MVKRIEVGLESGRLKKLFEEGSDSGQTKTKVYGSLEELLKEWDPNAVFNILPEWIDYEDTTIKTRSKYKEEDIDRLAASIKEKGQLQPALLRWNEEGKLVLVLGWTRAYACRKLNVPLRAFITKASLQECRDFARSENMIRNEYSPFDEFSNTLAMIEKEGKTVAEAEVVMGKSQAYIYSILKIGQFPLVAAALEQEKISSIRAARDLAGTFSSKGTPPEVQERAIAALVAEEVKLTDIQFFIDQKSVPSAAAARPGEKNPTASKVEGKGTKGEKGLGKSEPEKNYLQKFSDGKVFFSARIFPKKTELKEKKAVLKEANRFVEILEKLVEKDEKEAKEKKR